MNVELSTQYKILCFKPYLTKIFLKHITGAVIAFYSFISPAGKGWLYGDANWANGFIKLLVYLYLLSLQATVQQEQEPSLVCQIACRGVQCCRLYYTQFCSS